MDSSQGYNLYKWVICPLPRVINLHITSYKLSILNLKVPTIRIPVVKGGPRPFPIFRDRAVPLRTRGVTVERNAVEGGVIGPTVVTHHWPKFAEFLLIFGHGYRGPYQAHL